MIPEVITRSVAAVAFMGAVAGGVYLLGHPPGSGAAAQVLEGVGGVRVVAGSPVDSAMEAAMSGTVGVVDGCLGLVGPSGRGGTVLSWPRGSRPLGDEVGVRLPTGRSLRAGEHVDVGGGTGDADAAAREACGTGRVWLVGDVALPEASASTS